MPAEPLELLMAGTAEHDLTTLEGYRAVGGYAALAKARAMEPQAVIDEITAATIRGRGGAGFPMGRKASLLAKDRGPVYLVVNADESEPGAFKDRDVMRFTPHRLIEGCLITAHGIESRSVFVYIRGEYLHEFEVLRRALAEAREAGLLGDVTIVLHRGAGAYICGEETALLESLEGRRGQPRPRPPFPPVVGLYGRPTQINNVSTIALVPKVIELGAEEFAKIGVPSAPGTAVFSISGNVARPGNYERPLGIPLRELVYDVAGGIAGGRRLKAVIPGGSSVPVLTPEELDTPMDYDSIQAAGSFFGSAAIIVVDDRCCMVQLALRAAQFYMHESCGKCTPCRVGTRWLVQLLTKIEEGRGAPADLDLLDDVCERMLGKSLCALGDFAVYPVSSYLRKYRDEFEAHVELGRCPFGGESSLEGIVAPVEQHVHALPADAGVPEAAPL
ncbi:MAG TPA: NADH-quinone oxidoreductase subunit NuoF [Gaiellaceae bacterium]|nr:NADH-quinone oxidoreductase subunit NuoF [Gaiellaceae bacterium]